MKAIVFDGLLRVKDLPKPSAEGEALIQILQTGICNTDLEITRGYHQYHGILGHEFVGMVRESPDRRWIGRRVVGEINCVCHDCDLCRRGLERHCRNRTVLGIMQRAGALAEFTRLPVENLHEVPDEISNDEAVFVEPLAAACEITEQVRIHPDDRVCVIGDGKLAQLIAQVLVQSSAHLTAIGKHLEKLKVMESCGVKILLSAEAQQSEPELAAQFDLVVEATGNPDGFKMALRLVRPRGTVVLKSTYHGELKFDAAPVVVNEIQVIGSRCGPFPMALQKLQKREINVRPLISDRFNLEAGVAAFERAQEGSVLKVIVVP